MDKIINSVCVCKSGFSLKTNIVVLLPCEHLFHKKCIKPYHKCPLCNNKILKVMGYDQIKKYKNKYRQIHIDMLTNIKYSTNCDTSIFKVGYKSSFIFQQLSTLSIITMCNFNNKDYIHMLASSILNICNINIKITNGQYITKVPKIIISNHTNYIDPLILFCIFKCGFLASSIINDIPFSKNLIKHVPIITVNRGDNVGKMNTVDKIKNTIKKKKTDICIFPEGIITHQNTLARFRSGAFNTDYPVQPVIIKYNPTIYDDDYKKFMVKLLSCDKINVEVIVLPLMYPPFDQHKIELTRNMMSIYGDLKLSRVSNKYVID